MPCCCGSRVAGSGNPKRSRAKRSASGVLPGIGEVLPGVRAGHTKIRARASKSRGTRRDVAFASGCSETRFPRIAKSRCETVSRNERRERRRARFRHVRTRRARSQTGARGPRMDGRRVKPIGRRGRTARRISVQGRVLDRRTENPAGNQVGPRDRSTESAAAAATVAGNQADPRSEQRRRGSRSETKSTAGSEQRRRRSWLETKPASGSEQRQWGSRLETKSTTGTQRRRRPWLETKPTSGSRERWDRWKPGRPPGKAGGDNRGWKPNRPPGRPTGQGGRGGRPPGRGGRKGGGGGSSR